MVKTKKFIYSKAFEGEPKLDNFQLVEEELPELKDGEVLLEALYLSVDPYMRPYMSRFPVGVTMIGGQVARVVQSKNGKYPLGTHLVTYHGWRTHTVTNPDAEEGPIVSKPQPVPDLGKLPLSLALGAVGMPGNTAYFGFLELCQPKEGETVVVSGAAGAVGSLVGQIAKIKGCRVIGFAGSDDKVKWLKEELGFDFAFNYKTSDIKASLKEAAHKGIDCYFDNVGGEFSNFVIEQMNERGRISCCGAISTYNDEGLETKVSPCQGNVIFKQLRMEGFIVTRWLHRWMEGLNMMKSWINQGKIKYRETVLEGFEKMPEAFIGMMKGHNTGKMVVKI